MKDTKDIKNSKKIILCLTALLVVLSITGMIFDAKNTAPPTASELPGSSQIGPNDGLLISEILSNNAGAYLDSDNNQSDFVELFNGTGKEINLFGYGLSDKKNSTKWTFPNFTIKPNEYVVVNLCGQAKAGLNANFKLSSDGSESIVLKNSQGKIIDAADVTALDKNQSMIRNQSGWSIVNYPTPGFENSEAGLKEYRESLLGLSNDLVVNEVLPKNKGNFKNEDGAYSGYVELINNSKRTINLSDYYIGSDNTALFKAKLPDVSLKPGEIFLVYSGDSKYNSKENYIGFNPSNKNGSIILSSKGKITQILEYTNVPNGCAYAKDADGYYITAALSAGFSNDADGIEKFAKKYLKTPNGLIISEIMNSNSTMLPQNGYNFYDWIELYNNSNEKINLSDYCLSTDENNLSQYSLEGMVLNPGEYYILICSGDLALSNSEYKHSDLKIGNSDSVYLSKNNQIIDSVYCYDIPADYSLSRGKDYGWYYCENPSPGKTNTQGYLSRASEPTINASSGTYEAQLLSVAIDGHGTIRYTLDGSEPTENSTEYDAPISISKTTVLKAKCFEENALASKTTCKSFIMNDPHEFPVVSLVMNPDEFKYMYRNYTDKTLVYPGYVELFEENGSFANPCSVSLQGNTGRMYVKKNYDIKFEGQYGAKNLNYKLFDNVDSASFDSFVIRGGSNAEEYVMWKDEFATQLAKDYLEVRDYKTCILYINGEYWGIYNIREKINAEMIANHYNVDRSLLNMQRWNDEVEYGQAVWTDVVNWAMENDLQVKENYEKFCSMVDIEQFCDLWIYQAYFDNPDLYNLRIFSHPDIDNGKCKFIFFDLDLGLFDLNGNYFSSQMFSPDGYLTDLAGHKYSNKINLQLLKNNEFKEKFLERLSLHLHGNLKTENALALYDSFYESYKSEIKRDREASSYSMETYEHMVSYVRRNLERRSSLLIKYAQSFFNLSDSQMKEIFTDLF